jgi:hypothetical protein
MPQGWTSSVWGIRGAGRIAAALVLAATAAGCSLPPPSLSAVLPDIGYPRQLLAVDGTTQFAAVVWDVGLATETVLYGGLFGTSYFQIPPNATAGVHPVAVRNSNGTSAPRQVTVLATSGNFPAPRIADIGVLAHAGNGPVDLALTVAAANLDVDATLTVAEMIGGMPVPKTVGATVPWGGLPVDYLQDHVPDSFGYPVYHYAQLIAVVEGVTAGATLRLTVTNTDNQTATRDYTIPGSMVDLDSDGDGLLDSWEAGTYTAPSGANVPLADMGTTKWRKDVLVEVDWMPAAAPDPAMWAIIERTFDEAPVLNPDGSQGVNIIIDRGQGEPLSDGGEQLADRECLSYGPPPASAPGCGTFEGFFNYKANHFNAARLRIFHYAVLGQKEPGGNSGFGERHGNDFFVTLGSLPAPLSGADAQAGHFIHELGHNLGFSHGDLTSDDQNYPFKPNLPSVMNYHYVEGGVDIDCDMIPDGVFTYSQGTLAPLAESSLDEAVGICDGVPLDMNFGLDEATGLLLPGDGDITAGALDITGDGDAVDESDDFDQWGNLLLKFDVPASRWNNN